MTVSHSRTHRSRPVPHGLRYQREQVGRGGNLSEIAEDRPGLEELSKKRRHAVQLADERLNHVGQLRDAISYHVRVLGTRGCVCPVRCMPA